MSSLIVFTDLDGTFLDHETYDYSAALPALERLKTFNIPVIPVTSKTQAELDLLNLPLDAETHITENGMVTKNKGRLQFAGKTYEEITGFLNALPSGLRDKIRGFHDMSVEDVMNATGLNERDANAAKTRLASEPFLWSGDEQEMEDLKNKAENEGLTITRGGRFYHLMSAGGKDKAIAHFLENITAPKPFSVVLGDGPNDAAMLAQADIGVVIPNPKGNTIDVQNPAGKIMTAEAPGPAGWNAALHKILDEFGSSR